MDWTNYLQSIREDSENEDSKLFPSKKFYTITTVEAKISTKKLSNAGFSDFELMAQLLEEEEDIEGNKKKDKHVEQLGVLDGLRKYAKDHVLLQGKPGSGKSTALRQLLLEESETAHHIPVLLELKSYETSIAGLMREFLERHGANLSEAEILESLENGEFLLLVDGVNELPSETARWALDTFRNRYQKSTPMIFTTRDLGLGGNLGIKKKLEMLPLTESQMQEFVCSYLPDTGKAMLGTLSDKLREFGKTPLLLKMLCFLYKQKKEIPENLGLIFRAFVTSYENKPELKGKVPLEVSSKSFWGDLLQEIAFQMMQGDDDPKEIAVAISKSEAEQVIWEFCKTANLPNSLGDARQWLEELLSYHLIELEGRDKISFRHQLLQEYYAAEKLLKLLPNLDDESLKWEYLNYLKWTECIKLMCSLINSQRQANRIIDSTLDIDYKLAAALVGSTHKNIQESAVQKIIDLELNKKFKIKLFELTNSDFVIESLIRFLSETNDDIRCEVLEALGCIGSNLAVDTVVKLLSDINPWIRCKAAGALGHIGSNLAIDALVKSLSDPVDFVRFSSYVALSIIGHPVDNKVVDQFFSDTSSSEEKNIQPKEDKSLAPCKKSTNYLIQYLSNTDYSIRSSAVRALGENSSDTSIKALTKLLSDTDFSIRWYAVFSLRKIGSIQAMRSLLEALSDTNQNIRCEAVKALGEIGSDLAVETLIQALSDSEYNVRANAAKALGEIGSDLAVETLIQALTDSKYNVRANAAKALGEIGSNLAVEPLIQALSDCDHEVCMNAVKALGEIGSDESVTALIPILLCPNKNLRLNAVYALGKINSNIVKKELTKIILDFKTNKLVRENKFIYLEILEILLRKGSTIILDCLQNELKINYDVFFSQTLKRAQDKTRMYRTIVEIPSETTDYLVLAVLYQEYTAFKNCLEIEWTQREDKDGFTFSQVKIENKTILLARPTNMGETHIANLATRLISELKPKAVLMTGICAGNEDKDIRLGDVIVARKIFKVDAGKQTSESFLHDVTTYNLKPQWLHRLQELAQYPNWHQDIQTPRPKTFTHQKGWFLHTLYDHEAKPDLCPSPADHPDRQIHCPDWQGTIQQLVADGLITLPELRLTPAAIDLIRENRILHLDTGFPHDPDYPKVHIGAIATTSSVQEDPELFERIKKYAGQRNILGVEMEGAALGAVGEIHDIPVLVVKAVQDYGDETKSDQFREYAAEASARFLLKFLETLTLKDM